MTEQEFKAKKKKLATALHLCKKYVNKMNQAPGEVKRMAKIVKKVARELKVKECQVIPETIIALRCIAPALPKVKFKTLKEASENTNHGAYPCTHCDHWHQTSGPTNFKYSMFECPGCKLPYHKKNGRKFCSIGCHNAHQIRKVKEALKDVIKTGYR